MQMDNFQKIKILGEGTYGRCYLVFDKLNNRNCVLKQIEIIGMSEEQVNQSIKEAHILSSLEKHPFIVEFQSCFITNQGHLNIVMTYADGGDLSHKIKEFKSKEQSLSENQILIWFTQICLAIKHVHDKKIIHRDIKAQNIFLTKSGNVKLGDFGIAKHLQHTIQKMKSIVGTPYYMSPQICQNKQYTVKADIWSLGVILLQMCLLKPPFDANSLPVLALKISKGEYFPVPKYYSKELKKLVHDLLMVNPSQRPNINQVLQYPIVELRKSMILSKLNAQKESPQPTLHEIHNFNKLPSRNLFIDCKFEEQANPIQSVISPTNQNINLSGRNYDLPVKRIDNYMSSKEYQKAPVQKKIKKPPQLKKRQVSQPNLTPKNHCKIQNEKKLIPKNNSLLNLQKKKSGKEKDKEGAFRKKNKISVQMQQIQEIKKQIYNFQGQFADSLKDEQIRQFKIEEEQLQHVEQQPIRQQPPQSLLTTLEQTIKGYLSDKNLAQLYKSCQDNDGICSEGPCRGLVILAFALKKQLY